MKNGKNAKRRTLYWDSSVFIAWIKNETVWGDDVLKGMEQVVDEVYLDHAVILTSVITRAEVFETDLTPDQRKRFTSIFGHKNLVLTNVDQRIADKSSVIRVHYWKKGGSTVTLPDSIHLATAIQYDVEEVQTLDGGGKRPRRVDLLSLDGDVAGSRLRIAKPNYVPPPAPLEGPLKSVSGQQERLFSDSSSVLDLSAAVAQLGAEPVDGSRKGTDAPSESKRTEDPPVHGAEPQDIA